MKCESTTPQKCYHLNLAEICFMKQTADYVQFDHEINNDKITNFMNKRNRIEKLIITGLGKMMMISTMIINNP